MADIVLDTLERFFRGQARAEHASRRAMLDADDMHEALLLDPRLPGLDASRASSTRPGAHGLRRRRATVPRGRRRALGAARAHGRAACARRGARLARRRPRRLVRGHPLLLPPPERGRARRTASTKRRAWPTLAAPRSGAPGIRVFGDRVQPGADLESTRGLDRRVARGAARPPARRGVEVWLETHGDFATARGDAARSSSARAARARRRLGPGERVLRVRRRARGGRAALGALRAPRPPEGRAAAVPDGRSRGRRCCPGAATSRPSA